MEDFGGPDDEISSNVVVYDCMASKLKSAIGELFVPSSNNHLGAALDKDATEVSWPEHE